MQIDKIIHGFSEWQSHSPICSGQIYVFLVCFCYTNMQFLFQILSIPPFRCLWHPAPSSHSQIVTLPCLLHYVSLHGSHHHLSLRVAAQPNNSSLHLCPPQQRHRFIEHLELPVWVRIRSCYSKPFQFRVNTHPLEAALQLPQATIDGSVRTTLSSGSLATMVLSSAGHTSLRNTTLTVLPHEVLHSTSTHPPTFS